MVEGKIAVVIGVGPGLGAALGRRFAREGFRVALAARREDRIAPLAGELAGLGGPGKAYACDTTDEKQVVQLFDSVASDFGEPDCVIFNAGAFVRKSILETESEEFERCWRIGCLGGFLVGREAAKRMLKDQGNEGPRGTILFTGATASLRGGALFHNLAVGKFGLRALAQSMARELGPQGIHVAHVVIDGQIRADREGYREDERGPDSVLHPDAIAETYLQLYRQHRSAWSLEVDLRPWAEKF